MVTLIRPEGELPEDFVPSRRALGGLFFAGYAAFSVSAKAAAIQTDEIGLAAGRVEIPSGGAMLPAYVARPAATGRYGVVIVVPEVFGIHEYIRDTCRRLAKLGYVAVAPDLFFRAGDPAPLADFGEIRKIVETATDAQVMGDLAATLAWLDRQSFVDRKRYAITGFCWGGAAVWMASARFKQIKAGAAWYGRLSRPAKDAFLGGEARQWPLDVAGQLHAPVLGLYAGQDKGIPQTDIGAMKAALAAAHKPGGIIVYPDAQHGFHADYRDTYNEAAATDGWSRMLAWFAANGVTPGAKRGMF
ncbi:MAG: dienelactone hydrolase family protein [Caulobacteraceae bacterium]